MKTFRWPILFLVVIAFVAQPIAAQCVWRCGFTIDGNSCDRMPRERFGGAQSCWIDTICNMVISDPDGPGGNDPVVLVQCRYECRLEYCIWV